MSAWNTMLEAREVAMSSALPGTISGGQNIDWKQFCKVFSCLSALQEVTSKGKQERGRGRKEVGTSTDIDSNEVK